MFYYLYTITNTINGKVYKGVHQTANLDDGYLGSGKAIQAAVKKYGKESFVKKVDELFSTQEEMYDREKQIIDESFILRSDTYNIALGGTGGSMKGNQKPFSGLHSEDTKQKISKSLTGKKLTEEHKKKLSKNHWARTSPEEQRRHAARAPARTRDDDTRKKISNGMKNQVNNPNGRQLIEVVCPKCNKKGSELAMKRWHFENCKVNGVGSSIGQSAGL